MNPIARTAFQLAGYARITSGRYGSAGSGYPARENGGPGVKGWRCGAGEDLPRDGGAGFPPGFAALPALSCCTAARILSTAGTPAYILRTLLESSINIVIGSSSAVRYSKI